MKTEFTYFADDSNSIQCVVSYDHSLKQMTINAVDRELEKMALVAFTTEREFQIPVGMTEIDKYEVVSAKGMDDIQFMMLVSGSLRKLSPRLTLRGIKEIDSE